MRAKCGCVWTAILAVCAAVIGSARAATVTGTYGGSAYAVSSSDFLQAHLKAAVDDLSYYYESDWYNGGAALLTDGTFGSGSINDACGIAGGSITYYLDTELFASGFTVTNVDTYSGWQDAGRDDQKYTVSFRKVGSSEFTDSVAVDYTDGASETFIGKHVNISGLREENVDAVRFTFPTQENLGAGYMELDVGGEEPTPSYSVAGTSQADAYVVSSSDLLQTALAFVDNKLALYAEDGWSNLGVADLTDGTFGSGSTSCGISGGSVTYGLNTSTSPAGYDITAIDTYAGWANANRDDQHYTVSVRRIGTAVFEDIVTVNYAGSMSQDHVAASGLTLKNVEAIRFTFLSQENNGVGYKELDVTGTPSIASYNADVTRLSAGDQSIASNGTSSVRLTEGSGTLHSISLGANPTVIDTLTETTTAGLATVDPASQVLALNGIYLESAGGGLAIGTGSNNGTLKSARTTLVVGNASANAVAVHSVIADGSGTCTLVKTGTGALTLDAANTYSGGTLVKTGTLQVATGGTLGSGPVDMLGGTLAVAGGTVAPSYGDVKLANSVIAQTAGSFSSPGYLRVASSALNLTGGNSYVGWEAMLGWNGAASTATIGGGHEANWMRTRLGGSAATLNLLSGGKLYTDKLFNVGGTGVVSFDGGVLGMSNTNPYISYWNWLYAASGSLSLLVKDGGAVIDTAYAYSGATIQLPLQRDGTSSGGLTKTGANTLSLTARSSYAGATAVQGGTLKLSPLPLLVNTGFESPGFAKDGDWGYLASDGVQGGWTMTNAKDNGSGICRNGGPWLNSLLAPQGIQVCFIQKGASISQPFQSYFSGTHRLTFQASNRPGYNANPLKLLIDDVEVATWTAATIGSDSTFKTLTADFILTQGMHVIKFQGLETTPGVDVATVIDGLQFTPLGDAHLPGTLPADTSLSVARGAALDLNGASLSLSSLSGGGLVFNGAGSEAVVKVDGAASTEFSGSLTGAVSFVKSGSGTLTLSGGNAYTGSTAIDGGTLLFGASIGETVGTSTAYAKSNDYTFVPAQSNLLLGLWPSATENASAPQEGTGSAANLTDGVIVSTGVKATDYPYSYAVGNGTVLTYTLGTAATGCAISQINIYSGWGDSGRENITLSSISYSTVSDPSTFVALPNSAIDYEGGTGMASAKLKASDGILASNVYAIRFNFGNQENGYVGYRELEVIGVRRPVLPPGTAVTVASGATLDLNGNSQTLAGVSGSGTITNGTLAVNGTIAPGGTNTIGTLTIASTVSLSGTLLIDAAQDGACDLLKVQGGLNLSGLTLQIQDLGQLKASKEYVIATCTPGALTGQFISNNLGSKLSICYNTGSGKVSLTGRGLLVTIR